MANPMRFLRKGFRLQRCGQRGVVAMRRGASRQVAEEAVALEAGQRDRQHLADRCRRKPSREPVADKPSGRRSGRDGGRACSNSTSKSLADAGSIERRLLAVDELLQLRETLIHRRRVDRPLHLRRRRTRPRRILERVGRSVTDLLDQREGRGEIVIGFDGNPTMKSDENAMSGARRGIFR